MPQIVLSETQSLGLVAVAAAVGAAVGYFLAKNGPGDRPVVVLDNRNKPGATGFVYNKAQVRSLHPSKLKTII
jgi:hypothetical protein